MVESGCHRGPWVHRRRRMAAAGRCEAWTEPPRCRFVARGGDERQRCRGIARRRGCFRRSAGRRGHDPTGSRLSCRAVLGPPVGAGCGPESRAGRMGSCARARCTENRQGDRSPAAGDRGPSRTCEGRLVPREIWEQLFERWMGLSGRHWPLSRTRFTRLLRRVGHVRRKRRGRRSPFFVDREKLIHSLFCRVEALLRSPR